MDYSVDENRLQAEYRGEYRYDDPYRIIRCRECGARTVVAPDVISAGCIRHTAAPVVRETLEETGAEHSGSVDVRAWDADRARRRAEDDAARAVLGAWVDSANGKQEGQ